MVIQLRKRLDVMDGHDVKNVVKLITNATFGLIKIILGIKAEPCFLAPASFCQGDILFHFT